MKKPVILKKHHKFFDVIAYGDYVMTAPWTLWNWKKLSQDELKQRLITIDMTQQEWQKIVDAIDTGEGDTATSVDLAYFATEYVKEAGMDENMRQIVLNAEGTSYPYGWCRVVDRTDKEMRQRIIDDKNPKYAWMYLVVIDSNDKDMRLVVLEARDPHWIESYCYRIGYDEEMYEALLDIKDPCTAIQWCEDFGIDPKMRQIILDEAKNGDNQWAYKYTVEIDRNDSEMWEVAKTYQI